jgi:hypothetical protein
MERNPWKLATIGLVLMGTTALGAGLTTAWMMKPPATAIAQEAPVAASPAPPVRYAVASPAPRAVTPAVARPTTPAVTPVSTTAATDCSTGGERAMRIAKPGALGALLGAGLGAAGGAIADGGKAAGKGAMIGGIAGAALGGGYGAYKTKQECGTIFGNAFNGPVPASSPSSPTAAFGDARGITVYNAR